MFVAELIELGIWLRRDERWPAEVERAVETLLRQVITELDDCAVALCVFEEEREAPRDAMSDPQARDAERERERVHEDALAAAGVERYSDLMRHRVEVDLRRADWKAGSRPQYYRRRIIFLHAHSFVHHVDMLVKILKKVGRIATTHERAINKILAPLHAALGAAKDVRDSVQHLDERVLGEIAASRSRLRRS